MFSTTKPSPQTHQKLLRWVSEGEHPDQCVVADCNIATSKCCTCLSTSKLSSILWGPRYHTTCLFGKSHVIHVPNSFNVKNNVSPTSYKLRLLCMIWKQHNKPSVRQMSWIFLNNVGNLNWEICLFLEVIISAYFRLCSFQIGRPGLCLKWLIVQIGYMETFHWTLSSSVTFCGYFDFLGI